jgi:PleD family two-component response regulator
VLPAALGRLHLSYNKRNNYSEDNDCKINNLGGGSSSTIPQIKPSNNDENYNNNNDKPLAKLLVVDDDSDIVQILKLGLLKNRFLVNAFTNPEEALRIFKNDAESYCLMLSDVRMPGLSGIQLTRKLKRLIQTSRLF